MKVVILAGGFGTRISEYTKTIPKPMIVINKKPILIHIMEHYAKYGFTDFYIALGYKGSVINEYFKNKRFKWNVNLINTGLKTMTGGRLKRIENEIDDTFCMTYGDGVSDVNLNELILFHKKNQLIGTLTAIHPPERFGVLDLSENYVTAFHEKHRGEKSWINGGFFVFEKEIFDYIKNGDSTTLERGPLERLASEKELAAFKHEGFWQPMDTLRDKRYLEKLWISGDSLWKKW